MFCFKCGQELPENAEFCDGCGVAQNEVIPTQAQITPTQPILYPDNQYPEMSSQITKNPFAPVRVRQVFGDFDPWCDVQLNGKTTPLPEAQDGVFPSKPYNSLTATIGKNLYCHYLWITDSRVIFIGSLSGGGGGFDMMDLAEGDKAGLVVAGHIRYEWLTGISYRLGSLPVTKEAELRWSDDAGNSYTARFYFNKIIGSAKTKNSYNTATVDELAKVILAKACHHRLSMTDTKQEAAFSFYQKHADSPEIPKNADPKGWNAIDIPCAYPSPSGREFSPVVAAAPMVAVAQEQQQAIGSQEALELNELKNAKKKANLKAIWNILIGIGLALLGVVCLIAAEIGPGIVFVICGAIDLWYGFKLKNKSKEWDTRIQQKERDR